MPEHHGGGDYKGGAVKECVVTKADQGVVVGYQPDCRDEAKIEK